MANSSRKGLQNVKIFDDKSQKQTADRKVNKQYSIFYVAFYEKCGPAAFVLLFFRSPFCRLKSGETVMVRFNGVALARSRLPRMRTRC